MKRFRVWCPVRGEGPADAVEMSNTYVSTHTDAAENWASSHAGFDGDPFTEIACSVQEWEWPFWGRELTVEVTVRAEPVFEGKVRHG